MIFFSRTHFYDLLGKEVDMREKRNNVLARQLEITEVEQALRSAIKGVDEEIKVWQKGGGGDTFHNL